MFGAYFSARKTPRSRRLTTNQLAALSACTIQALEPRRLLAKVAVFDDPAYVDTDNTFDSESDNMQASLAALGHTVSTFSGITAPDFSNGLSGKDALVIPERENGILQDDLSSDAIDVIQNFVAGGGGVIVNGFAGDAAGLLNTLFGYSLQNTDAFDANKTAEASFSKFSGNDSFLQVNDGTTGLAIGSLPKNALDIYDGGGEANVAVLPYAGKSQVVFLGWDWFDSNPPDNTGEGDDGGQDFGWQAVLGSAVTQATTSTAPTPGQPTADAGGPYSVDEGGASLLLDGSASSDPDQAASTLTYKWDLDGDGIFGETGANAINGDEVGIHPTFVPTNVDGPTGARVLLEVTDATALVSLSTTSVNVNNVAPTAHITGPKTGGLTSSLDFTFSATDPSPDDQASDFNYNVDWGDGNVDNFDGPGDGTTFSHAYATSGAQTITVTATDKDGGESDPVTFKVTISKAALVTDPADPTKKALIVGGGSGNDKIDINKVSGSKPIEVIVNGKSAGKFKPTGRILVFGGPGNDTIKVSSSISTRTELSGDSGNDKITGGGGADFLLGGEGNDSLDGGNGRDILIGGAGKDTLNGGGGDDILIAAISSDYEQDAGLRISIMNEWARTDQSYLRRVDHLRFGGGFNANNTLFANDDGDVDVLTGGSGNDWFFSHVSTTTKDKIKDLKQDEFSTEIFF